MILPDINVLVHAHNLDSPVHEKAKAWWDGVLAGNEGVGLPWVTILGFIRITTHRGILQNPFQPADACERISEWLSLPHFHIPTPGERHFELLSSNLSKLGTAGHLTPMPILLHWPWSEDTPSVAQIPISPAFRV